MNHKTVIVLLSTILASIIILGVVVISLFNQNMSELKNTILNNEANLSSQMNNVNAQVKSMTYDIQTMLDKQDSLIAGYTISYSKPNAQTLKCDVSVTVTPKTYSEDTTADLYIGKNKVPMTRSGNAYSALLSVSLADTSEASITFHQGGTSQSEILPELIDIGGRLRGSLLAELWVDYAGPDSFDGGLYYSFRSDLDDEAISAKIIAEANGQEIWSSIIENPNSEQELPFKGEFKFEYYEEDLLIYAEVMGSSGLTYRKILWGSKETDVDGVYDANGNLIEFNEYTGY